MLVAALITFAILLVAWMLAPSEPELTVVEPAAAPDHAAWREAA